MVLVLLGVALGAGYVFWLRDSSLVRVQKVTVTGIDTADGASVRAKLTAAGRQMTTLHVNAGALRRAVADEPIVHSLTVHSDFPHGLKIEIVQNRPVALLVARGRQVAVAPDGTVLDGVKVSGGLPTIDVASLPASARMTHGPARDRVAVAAATPARLLWRVETISVQHGRGAVAELKDGPVVIFGRAVELERKWAAAAAVLAQRSSQGATYIDVRMPDRPVAGGLNLEQDPQPQPEGAPPGAAPGSPGIVPAVPPAGAVTAGGTQPAPATGAAPAPGATATAAPGSATGGTAQASPAAPTTGATGTAPAGQTTGPTTSTEPQP
jgi:cell division septal protein FtsQ